MGAKSFSHLARFNHEKKDSRERFYPFHAYFQERNRSKMRPASYGFLVLAAFVVIYMNLYRDFMGKERGIEDIGCGGFLLGSHHYVHIGLR